MSAFSFPKPVGAGQAPTQPSNIFGSAAPSTSGPPNPFAPQASTGSSLFSANPPNATSAPSLFGQPGTSTAPAPTSLFATPSATSQAAQASSTSNIFSAQSSLPAATNTFSAFSSGPFGQSTTANASGGSSLSLFGAPKPPQGNAQQQGSSFLGSSLQGTGGSSGFGLGPSQNTLSTSTGQGQGQGQKPPTAPAAVTKSTRFNDLPEAFQREIEQMESFIQERTGLADDLKARRLGEEIDKCSLIFSQLAADFTACENVLEKDRRQALALRSSTERDVDDIKKAISIVEGARNPAAQREGRRPDARFPQEYFTRKTNEFVDRKNRYLATLDQLSQQLTSSVETASPQETIMPALRSQHSALMSLAADLATLQGELRALKAQYSMWWKRQRGSARDPFEFLGSGVERTVDVSSMQVR